MPQIPARCLVENRAKKCGRNNHLESKSMADKGSLKKIKSGLFDRSLALTKVAVKSSASFAASSLKNAFSDKDIKNASMKILLESQARLLTKELGELKGSLMKVGQMLALYGEHFFPKEIVNTLKSLNQDSPPLEWEVIEPVIRRRLTSEQLELLEIEKEALAAASMGQVHRATIKATGETICLKIQYPGVAKAIDSDIKTLRSILGMFKMIPKQSEGFEQMMTELKAMLKQEVDYSRELKATAAMYELLVDQPEFIVPKVYPDFSGPKILATSFEPGFDMGSPEVASLSFERRNRLAQNYARHFLQELFVFKQVQTDPHFGNYKIRINENGEDQIVLLDFGAVRKFSQTFIQSYTQMVSGIFEDDREKTIAGAIKVGYLHEGDGIKLQDSFWEITQLALEPWLSADNPRANFDNLDRQGYYMWSQSDLPNRVSKKGAEYALTFKLRPPPREVVFLDRKIGGVFIVLKTLDARFDGEKLIGGFLGHR